MNLPKEMLRVMLPGLLSVRGEFRLVNVAHVKTTGAIAGSKYGDDRWTVGQTQFQTIHKISTGSSSSVTFRVHRILQSR